MAYWPFSWWLSLVDCSDYFRYMGRGHIPRGRRGSEGAACTIRTYAIAIAVHWHDVFLSTLRCTDEVAATLCLSQSGYGKRFLCTLYGHQRLSWLVGKRLRCHDHSTSQPGKTTTLSASATGRVPPPTTTTLQVALPCTCDRGSIWPYLATHSPLRGHTLGLCTRCTRDS